MSQLTSGQIVFLLALGSVIAAVLLILQAPLWVFPLPVGVAGTVFVAVTVRRREPRNRRPVAPGRSAP